MNSFTTLFWLNSLANVVPAGENLQAIGGGLVRRGHAFEHGFER
jgi:hypothetical protein